MDFFLIFPMPNLRHCSTTSPPPPLATHSCVLPSTHLLYTAPFPCFFTYTGVGVGTGLLLCPGAPGMFFSGMFFQSGIGGGKVCRMRYVLSGLSNFVLHAQHWPFFHR